MSDDEVVAAAAGLAERILDEVGSLDQDWRSIASWARELAGLADGAAASPGEPAAPPPREES
jgi:hypothetical protein